jgi:hypothetical protein
MGLFDGRSQRPVPAEARELLEEILRGSPGFTDDGLSLFPDEWFGFDFSWAGRIHDWEYCSRAHQAGSMGVRAKKRADKRIGRLVSSALPWRWKVLGPVVRFGVWRGGYGSYNSCGPVPYGATDEQLVAGRCRHELDRPDWMDGEG